MTENLEFHLVQWQKLQTFAVNQLLELLNELKIQSDRHQ